jgi:hypothetical protein
VPASHWALSDESVGFANARVSSNCDHIEFDIKPSPPERA